MTNIYFFSYYKKNFIFFGVYIYIYIDYRYEKKD